MEKKQSRSVQAPTKGVGTESKKNQDVANGKNWPRGGRKREPAGNSFPNKNEPSRKPIPQRNKSLDKRPKPRGGYNAGANSGKENTGVEEQDAELGSVFVPGSKKQSLNHLLNFHYTPRGDNWNSGARVGSGQQHRWLSTQKHKYNKEQFLQANCQFVVNSEGDYKLYMNNPDALVDWDLVEQIHVQVTEFPSCPICLYSPVAAKMTRCGHVYCWSCILHYLALSDKTWRKCPICYESVHKNDLKSVIAIPHSAFNFGEQITLRLMKRAHGSLTAIPVDESKINRNELLNMSETKVNTVYSKLLLANLTEVTSIIDRERTELTAQLNEDENCPERCFIDQAINQLNDREKIVFDKISNSKLLQTENQTVDSVAVTKSSFSKTNSDVSNDMYFENNFSDCLRTRFESVSSEGFGSEDLNVSNLVHDDIASVSSTKDNNIDNNVKHYYFYQAADGQHIYLHAVNIRMLEHTYGSLEYCPTTIRGRIVEKEGGSMTEELRKRLRYLQHLPVTCQFEVAEIQLRAPVVSKETLDFFQEQIETRKKRRQRRARDEKRREKRIMDEENRRLGKLPEMDMHIESLRAFPQFCGGSSGDEPPLESPVGSATPDVGVMVNELSPSTSMNGSMPNEELYSGPSFAKMLATGKSKPSSWPVLSPSAPQRLISVTGSQAASTTSRPGTGHSGYHSDSDPEPEGYVPAPAYNQSFSDAIAMALEKATIKEQGADADQLPSPGGKKKKRNKQKVLFATSMVYSGK